MLQSPDSFLWRLSGEVESRKLPFREGSQSQKELQSPSHYPQGYCRVIDQASGSTQVHIISRRHDRTSPESDDVAIQATSQPQSREIRIYVLPTACYVLWLRINQVIPFVQ